MFYYETNRNSLNAARRMDPTSPRRDENGEAGNGRVAVEMVIEREGGGEEGEEEGGRDSPLLPFCNRPSFHSTSARHHIPAQWLPATALLTMKSRPMLYPSSTIWWFLDESYRCSVG